MRATAGVGGLGDVFVPVLVVDDFGTGHDGIERERLGHRLGFGVGAQRPERQEQSRDDERTAGGAGRRQAQGVAPRRLDGGGGRQYRGFGGFDGARRGSDLRRVPPQAVLERKWCAEGLLTFIVLPRHGPENTEALNLWDRAPCPICRAAAHSLRSGPGCWAIWPGFVNSDTPEFVRHRTRSSIAAWSHLWTTRPGSG